jgi:hypothetical protein
MRLFRTFAAILMTAVIMGLGTPAVQSHPVLQTSTATRTSNGWRWDWCKFQSLDGKIGYTDYEVKQVIKCAVKHYPVPSTWVGSGLQTALYIANRESGYECHADNPSSSAYGVFQVVQGTWDGWHSRISSDWWHQKWSLNHDRGNCRVNVMVTIREAHTTQSWAPWGF